MEGQSLLMLQCIIVLPCSVIHIFYFCHTVTLKLSKATFQMSGGTPPMAFFRGETIFIFASLLNRGKFFPLRVPYFGSYIRWIFSFQNNLKDLDLSCKMDLDLWDCLRRVKLVLLQNFMGLI